MMACIASNSPRLTTPETEAEAARRSSLSSGTVSKHVALSFDRPCGASKPRLGELLEEESSFMDSNDLFMLSQDAFCCSTPDHLARDAPRLAPQAASEEEQMAPQTAVIRSPPGLLRRSHAAPPPCIRNPYTTDPRIDDNVFCPSQCRSSGSSPPFGVDHLSRYHTDFHEIEQIGCGHFGVVFKVLRRIEGCLYAVKQITKQLHSDNDMSLALREVQTLVALGKHENIVGYFSSWFESEKLYIQMELCDRCMSMNEHEPLELGDALHLVYQVCTALDFIHERGIAHLDVKPDNIYVTNGVYKLGDFGCATLIDRSLAFEEGDTRYMPLEMMNGKVEHLDKVDIFSLGAALYELMRGSLIPKSGPEFTTLREGEIPLVQGWPMRLQSLIKSMMDPDPLRRPSAKEILRHPIFDKHHKDPSRM